MGPPAAVLAAPALTLHAPAADAVASGSWPVIPAVPLLPPGQRSASAASLGSGDPAFRTPPAHDSSLPPWRSRIVAPDAAAVAALVDPKAGARGGGPSRDLTPLLPALRFSGWGSGEEFCGLRKEVPPVLPPAALQVRRAMGCAIVLRGE